MTLLELVKHLRRSILDDTGGVGVAWEDLTEDDVENEQLRWSNEELTSFIDQAQKKACRAAYLLKKSEDAFNISVVAGTADYSLDSRIIRVKVIESAGTGFELIKAEYEDFLGEQNWRTKSAVPTHYIIDESDKSIKLYPSPIATDTLSLIYYRLPLITLDWTDPNQEIEIPVEYQIEMLDWAASLAYMKDEANTFDPARAGTYAALFRSNFTDTSVYGEIRRKRSKGRTVRYGGI